MMPGSRVSTADRITAAVITFAIVAAVGFLLIYSLGYRVVRPTVEDLKLFGVVPPPLPPRDLPPPRKQPSPRPEAAAAPPNLRAKATPVVAPTPIVPPLPPPPPPPPVVAATVAENGLAPSAGAADRPGPGTGAGSEGNGFGDGGRGNGDGGGGRFERETPPKRVDGKLRNRDLPPELADIAPSYVGVRYRVEVDGRVSTCYISEPSGIPELDEITCRLIRERFRYRPSLDAFHHPVASTVIENHGWKLREEDGR